jgi:NAD-dependent deacetylase
MKLVFFTGSGISQESGVPTFRDRFGMWTELNPEDVAHKNAWAKNKGQMLDFHNQFRNLVSTCQPNSAHNFISELEKYHDVLVVTQNVDNLHERAGSKNVIHLHGNLFESRSTMNPNLIYPCNGDLNLGDKCERGSQLRPNVVWFGEELNAKDLKQVKQVLYDCDALIVIGTSLEVYPANELVRNTNSECQLFVLDPNPNKNFLKGLDVTYVNETAVNGVGKLRELLSVL